MLKAAFFVITQTEKKKTPEILVSRDGETNFAIFPVENYSAIRKKNIQYRSFKNILRRGSQIPEYVSLDST